ncbi:reverse transcriptase domain-containing protein [Tanacetum coccineum]|uniref:Reverse transcriptase domain-containing protein n=1 Tax=Tanacetum coccineum TaxID=301880 RepID=A0ABQ5GND9_9ASTR
MAEALRVRDTVRNLGPLMGDEVEQEEVGENRNRGNGDGGNGMEEMETEEMEMEKMEMVMGTEENMAITSEDLCLLEKKYQVKYASCTLLNSALTWWNSHKRTIGNEAAYAMSWAELMKLMTEVYCPRNEIQKMEAELWNLTVKGNDLTAYTQRFQELILLCTKMVPNKEDRVERFIGGLPDNIQGNVITSNPVRFQDAVRIANQLMDKKLYGYAARSAESKRRMKSMAALLDNPSQLEVLSVERLGYYLDVVVNSYKVIKLGSKNLRRLKLSHCNGNLDRLLEMIRDGGDKCFLEVHLDHVVTNVGVSTLSKCRDLDNKLLL